MVGHVPTVCRIKRKIKYKLYDPTVGAHRCCDHRKIDSIAATLGFVFHIVWAEMYPKAIKRLILGVKTCDTHQ